MNYLMTMNIVKNIYADTNQVDLTNQYQFAGYTSVGQFLSTLIPPIFSLLGFALLFYFIYAGFLYLTAGSSKEQTAKARGMITHAIIGLIVLLMSFLIIPFLLGAIFGNTGIKLFN